MEDKRLGHFIKGKYLKNIEPAKFSLNFLNLEFKDFNKSNDEKYDTLSDKNKSDFYGSIGHTSKTFYKFTSNFINIDEEIK
ncbi:MAG TPA: hypothetical protein PKD85_08770 [Saprospiraceae bacterium]|nr:hypothetical protein [Saprospiraceae bacterium]